eukprot:gene11773-14923_t
MRSAPFQLGVPVCRTGVRVSGGRPPRVPTAPTRSDHATFGSTWDYVLPSDPSPSAAADPLLSELRDIQSKLRSRLNTSSSFFSERSANNYPRSVLSMRIRGTVKLLCDACKKIKVPVTRDKVYSHLEGQPPWGTVLGSKLREELMVSHCTGRYITVLGGYIAALVAIGCLLYSKMHGELMV